MRDLRLLLLALTSPVAVAACGRVLDSQETPGAEDSGFSDGAGSFPSSSSAVPASSSSVSGGSSGSNPGGSSSSGGAGSVGANGCAPSGDGVTNCGAIGESCCASLEVPGGTYDRQYNCGSDGVPFIPADGGPTDEAYPATVSSFRLDKYLVTVGRFRRFVSAWNGGAGYVPPAGSGKHAHVNEGSGLSATAGGFEPGWIATDNVYIEPTDTNLASFPACTWTTTASTQENLPINCVTWWEAYAFCIWDGGFLPSEAEWEYGAAGGSEQREYPWGTTDPGTSNQYAIFDCHYPNDSPGCQSLANIAPVGTATLGAGRWGQLDLAGELWEWTLDVFSPYVYRCTDCVNSTIPAWYLTAGVSYSTSGAPYVIRGASFADSAIRLLPSCRECAGPPGYRNPAVGFRCARTP